MEIDIRKTADLSRICLKDNEIEKFEKEMASILDYIHLLDKLNTEGVEPTSHVLNLENVFRPDKVVNWLKKEDVLKHAPARDGDFFKVPKVVDKES